MKKSDVLRGIHLGNNVAELDEGLENYFINTESTNEFLTDRYDIIKGVKGAGKSALLIASSTKQQQFSELSDVILVSATSHHGDPAFKRAFSDVNVPVNEERLKESWLVYLINILWPKLQEQFPNDCENLEQKLRQNKLVIDSPSLWRRALFSLKRALRKTELRGEVIDPNGYTYAGQVVLGSDSEIESELQYVDYNSIFEDINLILSKNNMKLWILLDRLDEAFDKNVESVALRSLLLAFKEVMHYRRVKIKIFIRNDIYDLVTKKDEFNALSHIHAKANRTLKWSDDKLLHLLVERFMTNNIFKDYLISKDILEEDIRRDPQLFLQVVFPPQVNVGQRKPTTFRWIIGRITDGQNNMTPRDLISFIENARSIQIEKWQTKGNEELATYLIGPEALTEAWNIVSDDKIQTQLYAEYKDLRDHLEKFRKSRSEHNADSLGELLGNDWKAILAELEFVGFIQKRGNTWKIPLLYRPGLEIIQGKAFTSEETSEVEEDEDIFIN